MSKEQNNHPGSNGQPAADQPAIAWPGKLVCNVLGPPSNENKEVNGRMKYRACNKCANSIGMLNVMSNSFLMILKGYLGIVGRSTALVADAIHSSADLISAIMLTLGFKIAKRPADKNFPYGYGKVEFLVAVITYASLFIAGIVILYDAISCIIRKEDVNPSWITLWGAVLSVAVNEMLYRQSICAGTQINSPSLIANAWEKRSDALSSLAVVFGIAGAKLGWHFLDPLTAIVVAFYILKFSAENLGRAFQGLMDKALSPDVVEHIQKSALEVEGVSGIQSVRSRVIGQNLWVDLEIFVDGDFQVATANSIKQEVIKAVAKQLDQPANVVVYLKPNEG